eukprot:4942746-Prorocentrum_lima.AAC.1
MHRRPPPRRVIHVLRRSPFSPVSSDPQEDSRDLPHEGRTRSRRRQVSPSVAAASDAGGPPPQQHGDEEPMP